MVKEVATPKQTGGGGFIFEDKISAWFLAKFLEDSFPFTNGLGKITKIKYQVKPEGWLFDDILIELISPNNTITHIAVSGKSNTQFSTQGASADLVNDIWTQYLNDLSDVFNPDQDFLCIVNSSLNVDLSKDINTLLNSARELDATTLIQRMSVEGAFSKTVKRIFKSFECPANLATKHNVSESDIGNVLSRLILLEFDFESNVSNSENQIITTCRNCLRDSNGQVEIALYERLCSIRGLKAPLSGYVNYDILIDFLRNQFHLKGYNNHSGDWQRIKNVVTNTLNRIPDKIGGKLSLVLDERLEGFSKEIQENKVVFLSGKSGYGKSVLGKKFIESKMDISKVIWIDALSIENGTIVEHFGISNSLKELLIKVQDQECYLFIDGIDRFFRKSINELFEVLSTAIACTPWRIILTCQTDDYIEVIQKLYQINIRAEGKLYEIIPIGDNEFKQIQGEFPQLNDLLKHDHLKEILKNLKFLDLLAFNVTQNRNLIVKQRIGETDIIDWIWNETIESGDSNSEQNGRFLQVLAEKQADDLIFSIPKTGFSISDLAPLPALKNNKIIQENGDKLFFVHDLFGDWARYKLIKANENNIKGYILSRDLFSPLWCKAVRLYAISLLEKAASSDWINLFKSLNGNDSKEKIVQNLFLEAIIFSSPSYYHLETLWGFFKEDNGALNRFFEHFLAKATIPNQEILNWAKKVGGYTESEASIHGRHLNYSYWPGVLMFIHRHKGEMIELARKKISIITGAWLEKTPHPFAFRKEAAEVAFANAESIFNLKSKGVIIVDDLDFEAYKAFVRGVSEMPEQVIELSLKLCRRIKFDLEEDIEDDLNDNLIPEPISYRTKIVNPVPWEYGPFDRPDDDFEKVCLETNALNTMMELYPDKAKEIILAVLIDPPKKHHYPFYDYDSIHYKLDIGEPNGWFPPFFTHGPFLDFLRIDPQNGIDLILKLINFASERWQNANSVEGEEPVLVKVHFLNQTKDFIGDRHVYYWFRNLGNAPHSVSAALMALEKFLVDRIINKEDISGFLQTILEKANSVAFLGLLNSIGKYNHHLFVQDLKYLLGTFEFYHWESTLDYGGGDVEGHQMIGSNFYGPSTWELAKEWHSLPHRKRSIFQYSVNLLIRSAILRPFFSEVLNRWKKELASLELEGGTNPLMDNLIAQLDINNYLVTEVEGSTQYSYNEPEELSKKLNEVREESTITFQKTNRPFQFKQALDNNDVISLEQAEKLWEEGKSVMVNLENINQPESFRDSRIKFGVYAILIRNKSIWEYQHPEYLDQILKDSEIALEFCHLNTRELHLLDIGFSWQSFVADYLPSLWLNNRSDFALRKLIGLLILKVSNDINKTIFSIISKKIKFSDPDFIQLQNLLLQWSVGVFRSYGYLDENDSNKPLVVSQTLLQRFFSLFQSKCKPNDNDIQFPLGDYALRILNEFINRKTPKELFHLSKIRLQIPKIKRRSEFDNNVKSTHWLPGYNKEMVYHAFSSLPQLKDATNEDEYKYILKYWSQIIDQFIFELGIIQIDELKENEYPRDADLDAIIQIARTVVDVKPKDNPSKFWRPLFQYGGLAHYYIDRFSYYFISYNLERKEKYDEFFTQWDSMIELSETSNTWLDERYYKNEWNVRDMTFTLLGLSNAHIECWNDDIPAFFEKASVRIIKWMNKRVYNGDVIGKLILLLSKKNGFYFLKDGIPMIEIHLKKMAELKSIDPPIGFSHREFEHVDNLAKACSYLWENRRDMLQQDSKLYSSYKDVVLYLVSTQNPVGLELQNRILT